MSRTESEKVLSQRACILNRQGKGSEEIVKLMTAISEPFFPFNLDLALLSLMNKQELRVSE